MPASCSAFRQVISVLQIMFDRFDELTTIFNVQKVS